MADLLSGLLTELGLTRAGFATFTLSGAWGLQYGAEARGMHILREGQAELRLPQQTITLNPGDLVVLPRGMSHQLRALGAGRRLAMVQAADLVAGAGLGPIRWQGPGPGRAELACGVFRFTAEDHPLLAALPPVLHFRPADTSAIPRLDRYLESLLSELRNPGPGSEFIVARLAEVLLTETLRTQTHTECPNRGWLRGVADPGIARVLAAFSADIARPWTVASLAKVARQSRSNFAQHFTAVMGEPPRTFITGWRMFHARRLLRTSQATLDEIALSVGYGSAPALSAAFVRHHGRTPGEFRGR